MWNVRRRGGFSDRNKIKPENVEIQYKDFDERTRNSFMNMICECYEILYKDEVFYSDEIQSFYKFIIRNVYAEFIDVNVEIPSKYFFETIKTTIKNDSYDDVLTLIEAVAQYWQETENKKIPYRDNREKIYEYFNFVFKREYVGYRFVNDIITPITDEYEIAAINETLETSYSAVNMHIGKAVNKLSDRENPDYENSIKESISAVEALCEVMLGITGKEATLGKMLKKLEKNGVVIHTALKSAFNTLYGYTSDANGIRHAGDIGGPASTFDEAKFMLVSCSAFINYLIGVSAQ